VPSRQQTPFSATVKVGLLTLISLGATIGVILWLQGRTMAQGKAFTVQFDDVDGLAIGAPVQLMGIRVGFVKTITPIIEQGTRYAVNVRFAIARDDVAITRGSHLSIQQSGLIGEKFLEITPPQITQAVLTIPAPKAPLPAPGFPVVVARQGQEQTVGQVHQLTATDHLPYKTVRLWYRITTPGVNITGKSHTSLQLTPSPKLVIHVGDGVLMTHAKANTFFTVENPMRLKQFLEIQLESAEALKATNDKINQLMTDDTIMTLRSTLKNTERLTAQASTVVNRAENLLNKASGDLDRLVNSGETLSGQITKVATALNHVVGDPALQQNVKQSVASLQHASQQLDALLADPQLKQTLALAHTTSQDAAASMKVLHTTLDNMQLQTRLTQNLGQLTQTLDQVEQLAKTVNTLTTEQKTSLQGIVTDTRTSASALKQFTRKLNGHFVLFKLMF
jgi:phospholipid/cholesterol/gamma-HCH transport system substrate-binding protein